MGIGVVMTLALLWLVQRTIAPAPSSDRTNRDLSLIEIVRLLREPPPPPPPPPTKAKRPPPPPAAPLPDFAPSALTDTRLPGLSLTIPELAPDALGAGGLDIGIAGPTQVRQTRRPPRPVHRPRPTYPRIARQRAIEGWVSVELTVDESGTPGDIRVLKAEPPNVFDRAAIQAVRRWRFEPATVGGKPVTARVAQRIDFELTR